MGYTIEIESTSEQGWNEYRRDKDAAIDRAVQINSTDPDIVSIVILDADGNEVEW